MKLDRGVIYEVPCERDGASTRNFLARKYPCTSEIMPMEKFHNSLL